MAIQAVVESVVDDKASYDEKLGEVTLTSSPVSSDAGEPLVERLNDNPFLDPKVEAYYRGVYEEAQYECRHVLDAQLQWTEKEERRLRWKLDWHVTTWACFMFFALQIDRTNLGNALSDNFLKDLNMTTDNLNTGNTIFYLSFLCAEIPSQLISKKVGPDRWIPAQMVIWSIVAASQAGLNGKGSFYATRFLLGILQGGFIPDLILWLSYFYKSGELAIRLSWFWVAEGFTSVVTALAAYGILHIHAAGWAPWRWLFLIEGLFTLIVGIAAFFLMPASIVQTKAWFRPKGWFTDRQISIAVNRVLRDDPTKGDMHNRMGITPKALWKTVTDYDMWPIYLIGILVYIGIDTPSIYLTLSLREVGFSTFNTNLLTIPSTIAGCFTLLAITWFSVRINERALVSSIMCIWIMPCLIALRWWSGTSVNAWGTFAIINVLLSYPYCHAIVVAWASRNSGSVRTRSVSAAAYNMCVQAGNIIASNIYRTSDAPKYHKGNDILIALNFASIALFVLTKYYYKRKNTLRERKWAAMTPEERETYLNETKDEGNKRLDFRFAH
ncbi:major facilitator superfamily domain-containing protein [Neohortaea acidophila]|uniref:Major facilitator superfamily domain-containing protein n=1 Tax=Neohortaea acidophila TaxID=245834 RepID=A0A6A6Q5F3_9PEZI|nr:major facilitator superfamily domain-containing protein [Neohortaea acidophila]KAF2487522.1 major facilitator superfamily domain-containing protein [Neohortaea acidophila]